MPFCARRCPYCDFNAWAGRDGDMDAYADALLAEARARLPGDRLDTLYVGGGTPTHGDAVRIERVLCGLHEAAGGAVEEFTVEANPGTLDRAKVSALVSAGVNRVSLGAQSFDARHLGTLGRIHDGPAIGRAVDRLREGGIEHVSLDLILAVPGQTLAEQARDLSRAMALDPEHVSAYVLTIEADTVFERMVERGRLPAPDDERDLAHLHVAVEQLATGGFERYEISNFARSGARSRHNLAYWTDEDWIGLGAGAHSHEGLRRWKNLDDPAEYAQAIAERGDALCWSEESPPDVGLFDALMMGLRLLDGVDLARLAERFGIDPRLRYADTIEEHVRDGLLLLEGARLRLTPRGLDLASWVLRSFLPEGVA